VIQVIRWLTMGLAAQTKAEKRFCEGTPLERPTDDEAIRAAISILRASEQVDKEACREVAERIFGFAGFVSLYGSTEDLCAGGQIRSLLAALPDKKQ
jgi:hypothetical protein